MHTTPQTMKMNISNDTTYEVLESWEDNVSEYDSDQETIDSEAVMAQLYGGCEPSGFADDDQESVGDDEEFPALDHETQSKTPPKPVVQYQYATTTEKSSRKKVFLDTEFNTNSKFSQPSEMSTNSFSVQNSENIKDKLYKTRMCRSIGNGEPCPHGKNCRFAHNSDELRTSPCLFGETCRFVNWYKNSYYRWP